MIKAISNYLLGLLIFLLYDCGLVVIAFFLIKEVTNTLDRNMTGNDILLGLSIILATTILLPLGTLRIVRKLRENGKDQVVHGMFLGLILLITASLINSEIQDRKEKKLTEENEAQSKVDNESRKQAEKELQKTKQLLEDEVKEIPVE